MNKLPFPKAVLFDKDGTLLDFSKYWIPVTKQALGKLLAAYGGDESLLPELLIALGVHKDATDIRGVLCGGTYGDIADILAEKFDASGVKYEKSALAKAVVDAFEECVELGEIAPAGEGLTEALQALKNRRIKLFTVTNDNRAVTEFCLRKLGIFELFDEIVADGDGHPAKPQAGIVGYLMQKYALAREDFVMVGDTTTDMRFAKNEKIPSIAVGETEENRAILAPLATAVAENVGKLFEVLYEI